MPRPDADVRVLLDLLLGGGHQQGQHCRRGQPEQFGAPGEPWHRKAGPPASRPPDQVFDRVTGIDLGDLGPRDVVTVELQRLRADRQTTEPVENPTAPRSRRVAGPCRRRCRRCPAPIVRSAGRPVDASFNSAATRPASSSTSCSVWVSTGAAPNQLAETADPTTRRRAAPAVPNSRHCTFTVARSSPRVGPRLMIAIGISRAADVPHEPVTGEHRQGRPHKPGASGSSTNE